MTRTFENQARQQRATALALPARWTLSPEKLKWILGPILIIACIFLANISLNAQDVLRGLTSNGGPEGKGTAFSIKSNGTGFTIDHGFADWGRYPTGDFVVGNDGNLYGMTSSGGTFSHGTIFKTTTTGIVTVLFQFNLNTTGGYPKGNLVKGADGNFYGVTSGGGINSGGTIFKITSAGVFTILRHLKGSTDGSNPQGYLVLGKDGNFYGINYGGGTYGFGTIFKITPTGVYTVLRSLNKTTDGSNSYASLTQASDGNLYGMTHLGGSFGYGTIFKITTAGVYTIIRHLNGSTDGGYPRGNLIQAKDGNLYGMIHSGGAYANGTIFKLALNGTFSVIRALKSTTDGAYPRGSLVQANDGNFYGTVSSSAGATAGAVFKLTPAGVYTVIRFMNRTTDGYYPYGSLIQAPDGFLYGMNNEGGKNLFGTIFKISTAGVFTVLNHLNGATVGHAPYESLIQGTDNAFYGTTTGGGTYNGGTVFKICGGAITVLRSFNRNVDGSIPKGSLVQAKDGNFYGVASEGGSNSGGTIFRITSAGVFTVIRHLKSTTDGAYPLGSLIVGKDSALYGTTSAGGTGAGGTVFRVTTAGVFSVVRHLVPATDGGYPEGDLVQGNDGNFYGITRHNPKVFKLTPSGEFTILRTLISATDGGTPTGGLVVGADGNFYGTTSSGGTYSGGTIFRVTPAGVFTTIKHLNPNIDGNAPKGNLIKASDGALYGMNSMGGIFKAGTIFRITTAGVYTVLRHFDLLKDGGAPLGGLIVQKPNRLIANPQILTTTEDIAKAMVLTGSGGSPLSYNIVTAPKNGTITGTGANRSYVPKANYNGRDSFYFTVSVGCLASAPAKVVITVSAVNDAPVLALIGNKSVARGTPLAFAATATDPDAGQTKTFSLITPPAGALINATTGAFTWTATAAGTFNFKIKVNDNGSPVLFDEEQITVTVTNPTLNSANLRSANESGEQNRSKAGLYPNPVVDRFTVVCNQPLEPMGAMITDASGAVISSYKIQRSGSNTFQVEAAQLKPGNYFLRVKTSQGMEVFKFVKR